ncbi:MAG: transglutaminase domain-containing protein [Lachnospiraceae bacterium]|nr:transglutaminase domain-containing protein [Lachnospiraceae bacterium]
MAKNKDTIKDLSLCEGIKLSKSIYETKENRLLTLLIKGFIVYLLAMGSIGFYLSALYIEYNQVLCHVVIFVMAIFSAMLYYRLLTENAGYLVVLFLFMVLVYKFRTYINSGFYAIVNITTDSAAQFFNIDIQRLYVEQIENRYVTVTFAVLFIGIVLDIFLNVYISRRMQYVTAIFAVMGLNMIPLYLVAEPDAMYTIMVLGGMAMAYVFKSGRHYSPQVSIKRDDVKFKEKGKKKKEIAYVYDIKAMINAGIIALAFVIAVVASVNAFKPKDTFNVGYKGNKYKELTMAAVSTILMDGLSGFFKMSEDVGGLESGRLGQVSTIRLDYETDLVVQFTPYNTERIYLKGFTGVKYNPYANNWTRMGEVKDTVDSFSCPEAESLKYAYEDGYPYASMAIMKIDNVESDVVYRPYYFYSADTNKRFLDITYYPRLADNTYFIKGEFYEGNAYTEADLYVPEANIEAVDMIIDQLGDPITDEDIVQSLIDFYQENYPYTIKPGKTPYRKDFVNDFLMEKKKGYCSYFASAAVLIYRRMGIPARYVEGYAIDIDQIYNGTPIEGAKFENYYSGYTELGETALVSVEVTDADAHAWVEVFNMQYGWHPVEVTPYATIEEDDQEDFWDMFADMMDDSGTAGDDAVENAMGVNEVVNKLVKNVVYGVGAIILIAILGLLGIKLFVYGKNLLLFIKANINDRLVFKYQSIIKKLRKRDKELREKLNYREQLQYLTKDIVTEQEDIEKSRENVLAILEKAGFSQDMISETEYKYVTDWCKEHL